MWPSLQLALPPISRPIAKPPDPRLSLSPEHPLKEFWFQQKIATVWAYEVGGAREMKVQKLEAQAETSGRPPQFSATVSTKLYDYQAGASLSDETRAAGREAAQQQFGASATADRVDAKTFAAAFFDEIMNALPPCEEDSEEEAGRAAAEEASTKSSIRRRSFILSTRFLTNWLFWFVPGPTATGGIVGTDWDCSCYITTTNKP